MPRQALVPIPDLAVAYLEAVETGGSPYRAWREQFGLSAEQIEKRSWRLRQTGWLPAGDYRRQDWLAEAREIIWSRLEWLAERERVQEARLERRVVVLRARLEKERQPLLPRQFRPHAKPRTPRNGSVLDLFG